MTSCRSSYPGCFAEVAPVGNFRSRPLHRCGSAGRGNIAAVRWDCTLHVVDTASLARFSARFLRGMHRNAAFDREYDADALIENVKQLIATDPETGARALGELAL